MANGMRLKQRQRKHSVWHPNLAETFLYLGMIANRKNQPANAEVTWPSVA